MAPLRSRGIRRLEISRAGVLGRLATKEFCDSLLEADGRWEHEHEMVDGIGVGGRCCFCSIAEDITILVFLLAGDYGATRDGATRLILGRGCDISRVQVLGTGSGVVLVSARDGLV